MQFLHFADAHVNNVMGGRVDKGLPVRMLDIFANFDMLVDYALAHQVDYVLFAGDMYLNSHPPNHVRTMVHERIMRLANNNVKVMLIPGNHDMAKNTLRDHALAEFRQLKPTNVYLLDQPCTVELDDMTVTAIPWQYSPLTYTPPYISTTHICIAHCSTGFAQFESGADVGESVLGNDFNVPTDYFTPFTYTALGHIHKAQSFDNIVYPGSLEALTWGEAKDNSTHGFVHWVDGDWQVVPYNIRQRAYYTIDLDTAYQLPTPDPATIYELTFVTQDHYNPLPNLHAFRDGAFDVKVIDVRPRPNRHMALPDTIDITDPTTLVTTWYDLNNMVFDTETAQLWTEISATV